MSIWINIDIFFMMFLASRLDLLSFPPLSSPFLSLSPPSQSLLTLLPHDSAKWRIHSLPLLSFSFLFWNQAPWLDCLKLDNYWCSILFWNPLADNPCWFFLQNMHFLKRISICLRHLFYDVLSWMKSWVTSLVLDIANNQHATI